MSALQAVPRQIDRPTQENRRVPAMVVAPIEKCLCMRCNDGSEIRNDHVRTETLPGSPYEPATQVVTAYCEHCNTLYELKRLMRAGFYVPIGQPSIVADLQRRNDFFRRLAVLNGDVIRPAG